MSDSKDLIDTLTYGDRQPNNWCRIGWHRWTRWEVIETGRYSDTKRRFSELEGKCKQCGLLRMKEVKEKS